MATVPAAAGSAADVETSTRELTRVSGRRFVAHLVDGVVFLLLFVGLLLLTAVLPNGTVAEIVIGAILVLGVTVGQVAYYVLTQRRGGKTPGKALTRIKVVDEQGRVPTTKALIKRTVPLFLEWFYVIAWVGMMRSPYRQRFGDRWARTYVVADR